MSEGPPRPPPITRREFLRRGAAAAVLGPMAAAACADAADGAGGGGRGRRVIVAGAGLAGLAAAADLVDAGYDVTVVEARPRPGGRVHTLRGGFADGLYAEAGAVFVPGHHATLLAWVHRLGLPLVPARSADVAAAGYRYHVGGAYVEPPDWPLPLGADERGMTAGALMRRYVGPVLDAIGDPGHPAWPSERVRAHDAVTFAEFLRSLGASDGAVALLRRGYLDEWGDGVDAVSALAMLRDLALNRERRTSYLVEGGSDRLPAALAARLEGRLRYSAPLVAIEQGRREVRAIVEEEGARRTLTADRLICAIPFAALRRVRVTPPFAPEKRDAVASLGHTSVTRVFMQARARFWGPADATTATVTDLPLMILRDATAGQPGRRGILEAYVTGANARALSRMDGDRRARAAVEMVETIHPGAAAQVEHVRTIAWHDDPWAGGGYAWFRPGEFRRISPHLATPEGRVHFAGDHTSPLPGWMEGALASGRRAAEGVMAE